jgi:hypothetical protein
MNIAVKDFLLFLYEKSRVYLQRMRYDGRFTKPEELIGNQIIRVKEISGNSLRIPEAYKKFSHSYSSQNQAIFQSEEVYSFFPSADVTIHDARFVEIGPESLLDMGKQNSDRCPGFEKGFQMRPSLREKLVLLPWGGGGASYGDFLIQFLPKLARLIAAIPKHERKKTTICLHAFHVHPWALSLLDLIDIPKERIITGLSDVIVPPDGRLIFGSGSRSRHGIAHPEDIREFLKLVAPRLSITDRSPWRKIYISRKMGRKMAKEELLVEGLVSRGFEIMCLEELGLSEQIRAFQEAAVIVGPHGAGHANIMWSQPGIHLIEVFNQNWMHPCYALLAEIKGIHYHCLVGKDGKSSGRWTTMSRFGIFENPSIEPDVLFQKIDSILKL